MRSMRGPLPAEHSNHPATERRACLPDRRDCLTQPTPAEPVRRNDRPWIILAAAVFLAVLGTWLWFTPAGFWGKLRGLGYAVCHQLEERSFCIHGICSPLCAR